LTHPVSRPAGLVPHIDGIRGRRAHVVHVALLGGLDRRFQQFHAVIGPLDVQSGARVSLGPLRALLPGIALGTLGPGFSGVSLRALGALCAGVAFFALGALGAGLPGGALRAGLSLGSLGSGVARVPLGPFRSGDALRARVPLGSLELSLVDPR